MSRLLRSLLELSPAGIARWIAEPWRLRVRLAEPDLLDLGGAISRIFPGIGVAALDALRLDLLNNHDLFRTLDDRLVERRRRRTVCDEWKEVLYLLVRLQKPRLMVETGVFDGESSAILLQAMHDNGEGRLISIDLPAQTTIEGSTHLMKETHLPPGLQPGWVIPDRLRGRHELILGDSRALLPPLLKDHPVIDIFFHDSLHVYDHQYFEYRTAWERLPAGGLLVSDDISWNAAFHTFCRDVRRPYVRTAAGRIGVARK